MNGGGERGAGGRMSVCIFVIFTCEVGECKSGTELCQINEWQWVNIGGIRREKWIK